MIKQWQQFDSDNCSDAELEIWLRQIIPTIKNFLKVAECFWTEKQRSCENCEMKAKCDQFNKDREDLTCLILESLIPSRYKGTGYHEKNSGLLIDKFNDTESDMLEDETMLDRSTLKSIRKIKSNEQFMLYKNCSHVFTDEQLEVVYMRFKYGMKQKDIAKNIGKKRSAVSDRLRRAKKNMENYYQR